MEIREAKEQDILWVTKLAHELWPNHVEDELREEMQNFLTQKDAAIFLCWQKEEAVGFAQVGLRHDYVEGTESSPVGYLEGIYVKKTFRGRGIARGMLAVCENWSKNQGATEFGSDCTFENEQSRLFHLACGFREAACIRCFAKKL